MSPQKLGQHFLADAQWREEILRAIRIDGPAGVGLWLEIGAGHGEMTVQLARRAARVIAIELDGALAAGLRETVAPLKNVVVQEGDVLAFDLAKLTRGERFSVYGNLPYYITSPILHRLFEHADHISAMHLLMQYEVAERVVAPPGESAYGYLSVAAQWFSRPELVLRIPPSAFHPPPKVESALVTMRMPGARANNNVDDEGAFLEFVKECFARKRKTLRNNLRASVGPGTDALLQQAQLSNTVRGEELSIRQFVALFQLWRGRSKQ